MQPAEQRKSNLIPQKRINRTNNSNPRRPRSKNDALPINVGDAAPQEQEAAKSESVGRHDPLQAARGDVEVAAYDGEDDDCGLDGEGLYCEDFWC